MPCHTRALRRVLAHLSLVAVLLFLGSADAAADAVVHFGAIPNADGLRGGPIPVLTLERGHGRGQPLVFTKAPDASSAAIARAIRSGLPVRHVAFVEESAGGRQRYELSNVSLVSYGLARDAGGALVERVALIYEAMTVSRVNTRGLREVSTYYGDRARR